MNLCKKCANYRFLGRNHCMNLVKYYPGYSFCFALATEKQRVLSTAFQVVFWLSVSFLMVFSYLCMLG